MSVIASELVFYGSLDRPTSDNTITGGGIDIQNRPVFTQLGSNAALEVVSSAGGDVTQTLTVTGRDAASVYQTSTATLNGASAVQLSPATIFQRVLTVALSGTAAGTITLRKTSAGATLGTIPPGELGFFAMFINSYSSGASQVRWEKVFLKNTDPTLALVLATVTLSADSVGGLITAGVGTALNDTTTIANRKTAPAGISFAAFGVPQGVPNSGSLTSGSAVSVWVCQALGVNQAVIDSTFAITVQGSTT
jgi:hypothetical protein